jgi:hypothetical protein
MPSLVSAAFDSRRQFLPRGLQADTASAAMSPSELLMADLWPHLCGRQVQMPSAPLLNQGDLLGNAMSILCSHRFTCAHVQAHSPGVSCGRQQAWSQAVHLGQLQGAR